MPKKTDEILARIEAFNQAKGSGVIIQRAVRRLRMSNGIVLRHVLRAGTSASDVLTTVARALRAPSIRAPGGFRAVNCRPFRSVRRRFRRDLLLRDRDPEGIPLYVSAFPAANMNGSRTGHSPRTLEASARSSASRAARKLRRSGKRAGVILAPHARPAYPLHLAPALPNP